MPPPNREQIMAAALAGDVARYNLFTNPGMNNWQRGNGPFTASNVITTDRWQVGIAGTDTYSLSRDVVNNEPGQGACAALAFTLGNGAGGTWFAQRLQPGDVLDTIKGRTVTLAVRCRTNVPNAVKSLFTPDNTVGNVVPGLAHPGDGTWQTLRQTWVVPVGATNVWAGLQLLASATVYIGWATLVVGGSAMDYYPLHPQDDLARCQRYYEIFFRGYGDTFTMGQAYTTSKVQAAVPYKVRKAITPAITIGAPASFQAFDDATWRAPTSASPQWLADGTCAVDMTFASAFFLLGAAAALVAGGAANLTVEANP